MADKQESWFQAFALNVLLVASICTVGVAGYTIYNLNGTLSNVNKTILPVQEAVGKANDLLDQADAVEFDKGLWGRLSSSIVTYGYGIDSVLVDGIKEFVDGKTPPRISNRVQTSLRVFVDSRQLGRYHDLNELLDAVLTSLRNCTNGSADGLVFEIRKLLCSANGLTLEAEQLLQKFNRVLPEVTAVLQDMHRSGVIHKIGDAVGGVGTAVSVLNGDLNGFGVGFFDKILATVEKLKKYADDHPDCESITQEDRDLLENMVTVYLPDVEECLAPPPGMTKNEYIECLGLSGKDFAALSVLAKFDDNSIKNGDDYERLMQVLREYPKGLSSCIICLDGNFWFNLKEFVDRVTKYGINGSVAGTLFHVIPFTVGMNFGAATPPEAVYSGVV